MRSHLICSLIWFSISSHASSIDSEASSSIIKLEVEFWEAGVSTSFEDAQVTCFDSHPKSGKSVLTDTVNTTKNGRAELYYNFEPTDDHSKLNLYCKIEKENAFTTFTKTYRDHDPYTVADFGVVRVYPDRVARGDSGRFNGCGPNDWPEGLINAIDAYLRIGEACENHDLCFESCGETLSTCNIEFKYNADSLCNEVHDDFFSLAICKSQVRASYTFLSLFGAGIFESSQERGGCNE